MEDPDMTLSKLTRVLFYSLPDRLLERDGLNRYFAIERSGLPASNGKANGNHYPIEVAKPLSHPLSAFPGMLYMQMKPVDNMRMVFFKSRARKGKCTTETCRRLIFNYECAE